jgi:hypothetical protein
MMFKEHKKITQVEMNAALVSLGFLCGHIKETLYDLEKQQLSNQEKTNKKYKKYDPNDKGTKKENDFAVKLVAYRKASTDIKELLANFATIMQETNDFLLNKEAVLVNDEYMFPTDVSLEKYSHLNYTDSYSYGTIMMGIMIDEIMTVPEYKEIKRGQGENIFEKHEERHKYKLFSIREGFRQINESMAFGDYFKGKNRIPLALIKLGAFFGISLCKNILEKKEEKETQAHSIEEIPLKFIM